MTTFAELVTAHLDAAFDLDPRRAKYSRARLTSTQLCSYFVGSLGLWELEHEVRRRAAAASGDPRGADAVPVPAVIGGYPDTPGFRYGPYLESLISHGELPLPLLRRAVLGGARVSTAEARAG